MTHPGLGPSQSAACWVSREVVGCVVGVVFRAVCFDLFRFLPGLYRLDVVNCMVRCECVSLVAPQWGAADAEVKVPSGENTELKRSPFEAWSRSAYSHTCYAYCQGFLPGLFLPIRSIHLHFFQTSPDFFLCWLWLTPVPV